MGINMSKSIRAKFENGVIKPLEPLELREGEEILIEIIDHGERIERLKKIQGNPWSCR